MFAELDSELTNPGLTARIATGWATGVRPNFGRKYYGMFNISRMSIYPTYYVGFKRVTTEREQFSLKVITLLKDNKDMKQFKSTSILPRMKCSHLYQTDLENSVTKGEDEYD